MRAPIGILLAHDEGEGNVNVSLESYTDYIVNVSAEKAIEHLTSLEPDDLVHLVRANSHTK